MTAQAPRRESDLDYLDPLDIIFNCNICHDSVRDIYPPNENGRDDSSRANDPVRDKFWMTQCGHLICSKHVERQALNSPISLANGILSSTCPECVQTRDDRSVKKFFPIRGYGKDEHDPTIPEDFFVCPPHGLASSDLDSLRFQYLSLVSYGRAMRKEFREANRDLAETKEKLLTATRDHAEAKNELHKNTEEAKALKRKSEQWEKRMPEIMHYVNTFPIVLAELMQLRQELRRCGYKVIEKDYSYVRDVNVDHAHTNGGQGSVEVHDTSSTNSAFVHDLDRGPSSCTMRGSLSPTHPGHTGSPRKRPIPQFVREPSPPPKRPVPVRGEQSNLMPPPALPATRISPIRTPNAPSVQGQRTQIHVQSWPSELSRTQAVPAFEEGFRYEPAPIRPEATNQQKLLDPDVAYMREAPRMYDEGRRIPQRASNEHNAAVISPSEQAFQNDQRYFSRPDTHMSSAERNPAYKRPLPAHRRAHLQQYEYRPGPIHDQLPQLTPTPVLPWKEQSFSVERPHSQDLSRVREGDFVQGRERDRLLTPSPALVQPRTRSSIQTVSSPFFRSGSSSGRRRPESRGFPKQMQQPAVAQYHPQDMPPPQRISIQPTPTQSHSVNGLSFIHQPYSSQSQPLYDISPMEERFYRPTSTVPQTPRDADGLFTRHDYAQRNRAPASSHHFSRSRPQSSARPAGGSRSYDTREDVQLQSWPIRDDSIRVMKGAKGAGTSSGRNSLSGGYAASQNIFDGYRRASGRRSIVKR